MANRHLSRSIVLQSLFEWDFHGGNDDAIAEILDRNIAEFGPGLDDNAFIGMLAGLVLKKKKILDDIISKAAPDWPLEKINLVDRNILRLGLSELLFGDREQVPPKVAINEAIELAKSFGGENSSKFINGVLGAVYKEIGEPGKDQVSKKKNEEPIDPSKLPIERKVGAVVYATHEGKKYLALVHDVFGYWTLPKGGIPEGENEIDGTKRKVKEEIGVDITVGEKLGDNEYIASHPNGKIRKIVSYFLGEAIYGPLMLEVKKGLDGAEWFPIEEVPNLTMYDDMIELMADAIGKITK